MSARGREMITLPGLTEDSTCLYSCLKIKHEKALGKEEAVRLRETIQDCSLPSRRLGMGPITDDGGGKIKFKSDLEGIADYNTSHQLREKGAKSPSGHFLIIASQGGEECAVGKAGSQGEGSLGIEKENLRCQNFVERTINRHHEVRRGSSELKIDHRSNSGGKFAGDCGLEKKRKELNALGRGTLQKEDSSRPLI